MIVKLCISVRNGVLQLTKFFKGLSSRAMSRKQTFEWYSSFKVARLALRILNVQIARRQVRPIKIYKKLCQVIHNDKTTDD
jgi:hypothetical protein